MGRGRAGWKNLLGPCGGGGGGKDDSSDAAESEPAAPGSLPENHLTTINGLFEATPAEAAERPEPKYDAHANNPASPELRKLNDSQLLQALEMNFRELVGGRPGAAGTDRVDEGSAPAEQCVGDDLPTAIEIRCYTDGMARSTQQENPAGAAQATKDKDTKPENPVGALLEANSADLAMPRILSEFTDSSSSLKDGESPSGGAVGEHVAAGAALAPDNAAALSNSASDASSDEDDYVADAPISSLETPTMTAQVSPWSTSTDPVSVLDHWLEQQQMQQLGSEEGKESSEEEVVGEGAETGLSQAEEEEEEQELAQSPSVLQGGEQQSGTGGSNRLEDRVAMLEARCDELEEENTFLKDKLAEYEKQCQAMMDRVVRSNRQQELLKEKLQVYMQRNALLDDAAKSLLDRAQKAETSNSDLKHKAEVLEHFINERQSAEAGKRGIEGTGSQAPEDDWRQDSSTSREECESPPVPEAITLLQVEASADASGGSDISLVWPAERTIRERGGGGAGGLQPGRDVGYEAQEAVADTLPREQDAPTREEDGTEEEDGGGRDPEGNTGANGGGGKKIGGLLEGMAPPVCSSHSSSSSSSAGSTAGRGRQHEEHHEHRHHHDLPPSALHPREQQQQQQQAAPQRGGHQQAWTSSELAQTIQQQMLDLYGYDFFATSSAPMQPQAAPPIYHHVVPCAPGPPIIPTVPSGPQPGNLAPRVRGGSAVKSRRAKSKGKSPRKGARKKTSQVAGAGGAYAAAASREPRHYMSPPRGASAAQVLTKLGPAALPRKAADAMPGGLFEPIFQNRQMQQQQEGESYEYGPRALVPLRSHFSVNAAGKSQGSGSAKGKRGASGPGIKAQQRGKPLKRKQQGAAASPVRGRLAATDGAALRSSRLFQDQLRSDAPVEVPWQ